jgi:hypothetical protein
LVQPLLRTFTITDGDSHHDCVHLDLLIDLGSTSGVSQSFSQTRLAKRPLT